MRRRTFRGGIHPLEHKELSCDKPVVEIKPGKELVFLLSQHIGAPAFPVVEKGQRVLVGQKIAEGDGLVSVPVHSSISGTVKSIAKRGNIAGASVGCITIENDGLYEEAEFVPARLEDLSKEDILARIDQGGVVGMGGAGFPTHVKLSPRGDVKIDHVLLNGAECEPYLTSDYRLMLEQSDRIVSGLECMLKLFPEAQGVICIEDNKPKAIEKMREAISGRPRMRVEVMKTKYPQGGERSLIYAITGRSIGAGVLPAEKGCIVDNVCTAAAISDAVLLGKPVTHRIVTLSGDAPNTPGNYLVPVGMPFGEIVEAAGGFKERPEKVLSGGPMMGVAMYDPTLPLVKANGGITAFLKDIVKHLTPTACIRCGKCVSGCPSGLMPYKLSYFASHGDTESFTKYYGLECVECGACSYNCPARRTLTEDIKVMRRTVLMLRRKG